MNTEAGKLCFFITLGILALTYPAPKEALSTLVILANSWLIGCVICEARKDEK